MTRWWRLGAVVAMTAAVGLSGMARGLLAARTASAKDIDAIARRLTRELGPQDLVVVQPRYHAATSLAFGALPLGPPELGFRAERVFTVHLGAPRPADAWRYATAGVAVQDTGRRVAFDLVRDLSQARVTMSYSGAAPVPCPWQGVRHACPREPAWSYVGRHFVALRGGSAEAVWTHPPLPGDTLALTLPPRPACVLEAELVLTPAGDARARAPIRVWATQQGRTVGETLHVPRRGPTHVAWPVTPGLPVTLHYATEYNHGAHLCTNLVLWEPR